MSTAKEILEQKGSQVFSVSAQATVLDAALLMNEHRIGCLVVTDEGRVRGIFTERDVLTRIVAQRRDPATTLVGQAMTSQVVCVEAHTPIEEAAVIFKQRRIRHLPVVDDQGCLLGLVSIGDLNAYQTDTQEATIHYLHEYIYGRT